MQATQIIQGFVTKSPDVQSQVRAAQDVSARMDTGGLRGAFGSIMERAQSEDMLSAMGRRAAVKPLGELDESDFNILAASGMVTAVVLPVPAADGAEATDEAAQAMADDLIQNDLTLDKADSNVISVLEGFTDTDIEIPQTEAGEGAEFSLSDSQTDNEPAGAAQSNIAQNTDAQGTGTVTAVRDTQDAVQNSAAQDTAQNIAPEQGLQTAQAGETVTARMPQETQTGTTEASFDTAIAAEAVQAVDVEAPCPLENENDMSGVEDTAPEREVDSTKESSGKKEAPEAVTADTTAKTGDKGGYERIIPVQQKVDVTPEKLSASEQMKADGQVQEPVEVGELFDKMIESMESSKSATTSQLEIQLKPDYLGKVSIELSMTDDGLQAKIKADDNGVKELIGGQINQLIESLESKGVRLTQVEVVYTGVSNSEDYGNRHHQSRERQESSFRAASSDEITGYGDIFMQMSELGAVSVMDTGLSSVEYRA